MPWQRTGTVTVTKGSVTVTGVGTEFSSKSRVGDMFSGPDGFPYEVSNIASETVLTIVPAYKGNTAAGQGYILVPVQGYTKTAVDGLNRLMNLAGDAIEQVPNKQPKSENLTWLSGAVPTPNGVVTFNPTGKGIVTRPPSDFVMKGDLGIGGITTTRLPADNANQQLPGGSYSTSTSWTGSVIAGVSYNNQGCLTVLPWSDPRYIRQEWSSIVEGVGTFERWCLFGTWGNWFRNVREGDSVFGWGSRGAPTADDLFKLPNAGVFYSSSSPGSVTLNPMTNAAGTVLQVGSGPNSGGGGFQLYGRDNTFLFRGFTNGSHSPTRTVYHDGNAVGLVGAGAIIERGATANGEYTKFADGTLIQWGVITAQADTRVVNFYGSTSGDIYYTNVNVTLPTVYSSSSFSSFGNVVDRGIIGVVAQDGVGRIFVQLRHTVSTNATTTARWLTVGRWK